MKNDKISILKDIFCNIKQFDDNKSGYSIAKRAIKELFETTSDKSFNHIYSRLVIIDSLYSTQMGRRYYGLEELAETILELNIKYDIRNLFIELVLNPTIDNLSKLNCSDKLNIFERKYGIQKGGKQSGRAISLITKYAYFDTGFNFPIYDSIIKDLYPFICDSCGFSEMKSVKISDNIVDYLININTIKSELSRLFEFEISYDELDMVLWHIGKLKINNLSLVLSISDYKIFAENNKNTNMINSLYKTDAYKNNIAMRLILDYLSID